MLLLEANSVSKSFAGLHALRNVSFELATGEVHALVGENGAGKSTFIKIVAGAEVPDSGTLTLAGRTVASLTPTLARDLGVATIYQQPALFPQLSVAENIALALERHRTFGRVRWNARRTVARELLDRVGADLDPDRVVETLTMPEQQLVEIAKAIGVRARVMIMDEPTSSLSDHEVERLVEIIGRLRSDGVGVIYVSHRFDEIFRLADRVTVLRDGERVVTCERSGLDRQTLIRYMVGRELAAIYPTKDRGHERAALLEIKNLSSQTSGLKDVSFSVGRGEILGIAGLVGSGRTELAETIFGLRAFDSGSIHVNGADVSLRSPLDAIALGIAYVPEDRRRHGVVLPMSIAANVTLASLSSAASRGILDTRKERAIARTYIERLAIRTSAESEVSSLSGGNQQKVALARWLAVEPSILILDEPTQGVDVGAKAEIHAIMRRLADQGTAIVMISSELPEILGMSDRIVVMRRGTVAGTVDGAGATAEGILVMAFHS